MPGRPRAGRLVPRREFTELHWIHLSSGHTFFGEGFKDDADLLEGWQALGGAITQAHIHYYPGTRPWGWRHHDAPAPRQCLEGAHACPRREKIIRREKGGHLYYGRPGVYCCRQCWEEYYESQARYLRRLGLLTPQEAQIVPVDLDECDEWRLEEYEDCGDPSMRREQL